MDIFKEVTDAEYAFGTDVDQDLINAVPKEFPNWRNWEKFISRMFFDGVEINHKLAVARSNEYLKQLRHLRATLRSWEYKHEVKTHICAYMASLMWSDIPDEH